MSLRGPMLWAMALNAGMGLVEALAALQAHSVALLADAIDFFEDAGSYGLALWSEGRGPRAQAATGLVIALLMLLPATGAAAMVWRQIVAPQPPQGLTISAVALAALCVNLGSAALVLRARRAVLGGGGAGLYGAWLSSRNDALANLAMIGAGGLVAASGSRWPDIVVGCGVAALHLSGLAALLARVRAAWPR